MAIAPGRPVGILLAAGRAERFGGDKLLARVDPASEVTLGEAACRHLVAAMTDVIAVVRPDDEGLATLLAGAGARVIACLRAHEGMGASLACGVQATAEAAGWVVALADMPWVRPETITAVADAIAAGAAVAAPYYRGERGHPVGFGALCRDALLALSGDVGARSVLAAYRHGLVRIEVDDAGVLRDVDTPADL